MAKATKKRTPRRRKAAAPVKPATPQIRLLAHPESRIHLNVNGKVRTLSADKPFTPTEDELAMLDANNIKYEAV